MVKMAFGALVQELFLHMLAVWSLQQEIGLMPLPLRKTRRPLRFPTLFLGKFIMVVFFL